MLGLFGGSFPFWVTHAQACYGRQREVFNILKLLATHFCLALYSLQSSSVMLISLYPYNVPVRGKLASGRLRMEDGNGRDHSRARFEYKPPDTLITTLRDTSKTFRRNFRDLSIWKMSLPISPCFSPTAHLCWKGLKYSRCEDTCVTCNTAVMVSPCLNAGPWTHV